MTRLALAAAASRSCASRPASSTRVLDADQLAAELTAYFRGLLVAVDGDQGRVTPDAGGARRDENDA